MEGSLGRSGAQEPFERQAASTVLGQRISARVLRRATQPHRAGGRPRADRADLTPVGSEHREDLEGLLDLVRVAIDLEASCDYGDRPHGHQPNRTSFLAHFEELESPLAQWDAEVERVQAAPGALWGWFERRVSKRGISEPPFAIGPLIDRLAILTAERARHGRLDTPHRLYLQHFTDRSRGGEQVSMYVEGQNVAQVPLEPQVSLQRRLDAVGELVQALFDDAQRSDEAGEIVEARDSLLELKQPLLDRLTLHGSLDAIYFADDCPVCLRERELQASA